MYCSAHVFFFINFSGLKEIHFFFAFRHRFFHKMFLFVCLFVTNVAKIAWNMLMNLWIGPQDSDFSWWTRSNFHWTNKICSLVLININNGTTNEKTHQLQSGCFIFMISMRDLIFGIIYLTIYAKMVSKFND